MEEAEILSELALDLVPENDNFHDTYAEIMFSMGEYDKALKHIKKAYEINQAKKYKDKIELIEKKI